MWTRHSHAITILAVTASPWGARQADKPVCMEHIGTPTATNHKQIHPMDIEKLSLKIAQAIWADTEVESLDLSLYEKEYDIRLGKEAYLATVSGRVSAVADIYEEKETGYSDVTYDIYSDLIITDLQKYKEADNLYHPVHNVITRQITTNINNILS